MNSYFRIRVQNERINIQRERAQQQQQKKFTFILCQKKLSRLYVDNKSTFLPIVFLLFFFPLFSLTAFFVYYMSLFHSFRGYNLKYLKRGSFGLAVHYKKSRQLKSSEASLHKFKGCDTCTHCTPCGSHSYTSYLTRPCAVISRHLNK